MMGGHRAPHQRDWFALVFWCGMGFVFACIAISCVLVVLSYLA